MSINFFGDVTGAGEIKIVPGTLGALQLEASVSRGGSNVAKIVGPGACNAGVIGATFHGSSPAQPGIKIEGGKFAGVFEPRPLGGKLVGAWDAVFEYNNGVTRPIRGFVRDARLAPASATAQPAKR
jgi:hypothetical protein